MCTGLLAGEIDLPKMAGKIQITDTMIKIGAKKSLETLELHIYELKTNSHKCEMANWIFELPT